MEAPEQCDPYDGEVELPCARNLRFAPHPILSDPRPDPRHAEESEHDLGKDNSHILSTRIARLSAGMSSATAEDDHESIRMKCCCGRSDCAYLEHNNAALGGLERNLETAAKLGQILCDDIKVICDLCLHPISIDDHVQKMADQFSIAKRKRLSAPPTAMGEDGGLTFSLQALLLRHESYINESQAERARLSTSIFDLEAEKSSLEDANEKMTAENKELLHQLEYLNASLADSDRDVKRLERLLSDCELELRKLHTLVRRTEELDNKLHEMELEREQLNKQMDEGRDDTRSMLMRWKDSERRVRELEEDVLRIEREARMDREQHEEIVARLEKERLLDRELSGAEGRLKGAAALQSMDKTGQDSKNVVSHFVKDILQDNANLQAGIAELRQLLQVSNEEVQNLREQLMLHQPVGGSESGHRSQISVSLDQELPPEMMSLRQTQQEVHVHHHYHAKSGKNRITPNRKPARRRLIMPSHGEASDSSMPSTPTSRLHRYDSSPVVPLNLQKAQSNRWSMQSTATMSSVLSSIPSSPRSYFDRGGSIFDRLERGEESSRPTSPESVGDLLSPRPGQFRFKPDVPGHDVNEREEGESQKTTFDMPPLVEPKPVFDVGQLATPSDSEPADSERELTPKPSIVLQGPTNMIDKSIHHEPETPPIAAESDSPSKTPVVRRMPSKAILDLPEIRPSLTRKGSHETLVSISGMDIHLAQRPSPTATLELMHSHFAHSPAQTRKVSASQPLASVTEYTAVSSLVSTNRPDLRRNQSQLPSSIEALSGIAIPKPRISRGSSQPGAIGRLGGWVRGRWGVAPTKSTGNLRAIAREQESTTPPALPSQIKKDLPPLMPASIPASTPEDVTPAETQSIPVQTRPGPNPLLVKVDPMILFAGRSPGVNQPGSIPGFRSAVMNRRTPSQVMASVIDEEGLQEGLAESSTQK